MDMVLPGLWIGSWQDADPTNAQMTCVCVANDAANPPEPPNFFPISDPGMLRADAANFTAAVDRIHELMRQHAPTAAGGAERKHHVLVYCQSGVNRSAAVLVAYLMKHAPPAASTAGETSLDGSRLVDAFNWLKARRRHAAPNDQLLRIAKHVATGDPLGFSPLDRTGFIVTKLTDTEQQVDWLYREILGRPADPDGLGHYSEQPLEYVRAALSASPEALRRQAARR